jgi:hypothetical protein
MSNSNDPRLAKTLIHGRPSGEIGSADIEQRAREIALIAGRDPNRLTDEDRRQARRELEGRAVPDTTSEDVESRGSITRDPSEPPSFNDRPKPNLGEPTEQEELEHTVLEGVEEAQHDLMTEARKRRER